MSSFKTKRGRTNKSVSWTNNTVHSYGKDPEDDIEDLFSPAEIEHSNSLDDSSSSDSFDSSSSDSLDNSSSSDSSESSDQDYLAESDNAWSDEDVDFKGYVGDAYADREEIEEAREMAHEIITEDNRQQVRDAINDFVLSNTRLADQYITLAETTSSAKLRESVIKSVSEFKQFTHAEYMVMPINEDLEHVLIARDFPYEPEMVSHNVNDMYKIVILLYRVPRDLHYADDIHHLALNGRLEVIPNIGEVREIGFLSLNGSRLELLDLRPDVVIHRIAVDRITPSIHRFLVEHPPKELICNSSIMREFNLETGLPLIHVDHLAMRVGDLPQLSRVVNIKSVKSLEVNRSPFTYRDLYILREFPAVTSLAVPDWITLSELLSGEEYPNITEVAILNCIENDQVYIDDWILEVPDLLENLQLLEVKINSSTFTPGLLDIIRMAGHVRVVNPSSEVTLLLQGLGREEQDVKVIEVGAGSTESHAVDRYFPDADGSEHVSMKELMYVPYIPRTETILNRQCVIPLSVKSVHK